jgi:hypothetical protein
MHSRLDRAILIPKFKNSKIENPPTQLKPIKNYDKTQKPQEVPGGFIRSELK